MHFASSGESAIARSMALSAIQTAFTGNPLDRAEHVRHDPEILASQMQRTEARFMLFAPASGEQTSAVRVNIDHETRCLTSESGEIIWRTHAQCAALTVTTSVFLGLENGEPRYAHMLAAESEQRALEDSSLACKFRDARSIAHQLGHRPELGILAQAKSMLSWHENHRYCSKCGEPSAVAKAGYERICNACETHHFPRTDPVVIMLVRRGNQALVGRGVGWAPGAFSALAGYMEPGESIEEATAREVFEEVGLRTVRVEYRASQPWPWPSTLMIGVEAWVEAGDLKLDPAEIAEAVWITKEDVRASMRGEHPHRLMPSSYAIAHSLVRDWLDSDRE
jgi:NAD+ diphosphatase